MYIYIYIYILFIYLLIYLCIYLYKHIHTHIYIYILFIYLFLFISMFIFIFIYLFVYLINLIYFIFKFRPGAVVCRTYTYLKQKSRSWLVLTGAKLEIKMPYFYSFLFFLKRTIEHKFKKPALCENYTRCNI